MLGKGSASGPERQSQLAEDCAGSSEKDEAANLQHVLNEQLTEDVARIFDESLYADIELVSGRLKVSTHTCILKTRAARFYQKLHKIVAINLKKDVYQAIEQFLSDLYTDCNIEYEEDEIIESLHQQLPVLFANLEKTNTDLTHQGYEEFSTPKALTPSDEIISKPISSPITELKKEYYKLVPVLDKELQEQDALLSAFQTIIKAQNAELKCIAKPTTLSLRRPVQYSKSLNCIPVKPKIHKDVINKNDQKILVEFLNEIKSPTMEDSLPDAFFSAASCCRPVSEETVYCECLSSSNYPVTPNAHLSCNQNSLTMDNQCTTSDSGLETNTSGALPGSTGSPKDHSISETSGQDLTECTLHDDIPFDEMRCFDSSLSSKDQINLNNRSNTLSDSNVRSTLPCKSNNQNSSLSRMDISKEESEEHNNAIGLCRVHHNVKLYFRCDKEIRDECANFLQRQCIFCSKDIKDNDDVDQGEPYRDWHCDEISDCLTARLQPNQCFKVSAAISTPSGRLIDDSNESSESNADSLEHETITDLIPKDLSPTIFELDSDSLSHSAKFNQESLKSKNLESNTKESQHSVINIVLSETPTNSIMQVIDRTTVMEPVLSNTGKQNIIEGYEPRIVLESKIKHLSKKSIYSKELGTSSDNQTSQTNISPAWVVDMSKHVEKNTTSPKIHPTEANPNIMNRMKLFNESASRNSLDSDSSERSSKKSMGFYVDLSSIPDVLVEKKVQENTAEKKNIFSMYIELGDNSNVKEMPQNLSSVLNAKKVISSKSAQTSRNSSFVNCSIGSANSVPMEVPHKEMCEEENISKSSSEKELPIIPSIVLRRRKDNIKSNINRHSWNAMGSGGDGLQQLKTPKKRTQSFNLGNSDPSITKIKTKDSVSGFGISPTDDYTYSKSEISSFSASSDSRRQSESFSLPAIADDEHLHLCQEAGAVAVDGSIDFTHHKKRRQCEAKINETFDKSSTCSTKNDLSIDTSSTITDKNDITCQFETMSEFGDDKLSEEESNLIGSLSQLVEVMETNDLGSTAVFEEVEKLCKEMSDENEDSECSISNIVSLMRKRDFKSGHEKTNKTEVETAMENLQAVIDKQKQILAADEKAENEQQKRDDVFVKLSDLDKALPKISLDSAREHVSNDGRMTRSIPEPTCKDQNKGAMSRSTEIFTSFHSENAASLSRLFPHLKKEFSRSNPNSLGARPNSSSIRTEDQSDISEISSMQSSTCQSNVECSTTDDTSQSSCGLNNAPNYQTRLGEDLLRMFLEEIAPDVTVEVDGRRVKAHKCILSSRCQYFAAMLSGGWVESAGNVISLRGFSYNVVHFALRHIYSGASTIPDSISIVELATLSDMLGLEGLKEVIMYTLKVKYCHMFHKPCSICSVGVLECLPLSAAYGLDQVYLKSVRWITKYFVRIWPTKPFATLPRQLIEKCFHEQVVNMSPDNVLMTVSGCGRVSAEVAPMAWGDSVRRVCQRLMGTAAKFTSVRLQRVLQTAAQGGVPSDAFVGVGSEAIDDCLMAAFELASPEQMCLSYQLLFDLINTRESMVWSASCDYHNKTLTAGEINSHLIPGTELEWRVVERWRLRCEGGLVRNITSAANTSAWKQLDITLRQRLQQSASIVLGGLNLSITQRSPIKLRSKQCTPKPSIRGDSNGPVRNEKITVAKRAVNRYSLEQIRAAFNEKQSRAVGKNQLQLLPSTKDLRLTQTLPRALSNPPAPLIHQRSKQHFKYEERIPQQVVLTLSSPNEKKSKKYDNVQPRYLEPRPNRETGTSNTSLNMIKPNQALKKKLSSSESSRNSTPAFAVHSLVESKKDVKSSNVREAAREKTSSESSPVHTPVRCLNNSCKNISSKSQEGSSEKRTPLSQSGNVNSARMSRPKTRSVSNVKSNQKSQNDLSPLTTLQQRDVSLPVTSVPLLPRPCKRESPASSPSKKKNQRSTLTPVKTTLPGTLMKATKSSSAKVVAKTPISKQNPVKSPSSKNVHSNMSQEINVDCHDQSISDIPVMERSGTFLKEEPSVLGKSGEIVVID